MGPLSNRIAPIWTSLKTCPGDRSGCGAIRTRLSSRLHRGRDPIIGFYFPNAGQSPREDRGLRLLCGSFCQDNPKIPGRGSSFAHVFDELLVGQGEERGPNDVAVTSKQASNRCRPFGGRTVPLRRSALAVPRFVSRGDRISGRPFAIMLPWEADMALLGWEREDECERLGLRSVSLSVGDAPGDGSGL